MANGGNAYWKLEYKCSKRALLTALEAKGFNFQTPISKANLVKVQRRLDRGLLYYEDNRITTKELSHFIKDRKLSPPTSGLREAMVLVLTAADEGQTFDRFSDLPPELRERIYGYYFSTFPKPLRCAVQPPLARASRLMRQEVLPVFYHLHEFQLELYCPQNGSNDYRKAPLIRKTLLAHQDTMGFLNSLSARDSQQVNAVCIDILHYKTLLIARCHLLVAPSTGKITVFASPLKQDQRPAKYPALIKSLINEMRTTLTERLRDRARQGIDAKDIYALRRAAEKAFL